MKNLKKNFWKLFRSFWPIGGLLLLSLIYFYPVILQKKIPLPVDALVGAHIPWTEVEWEGYPAGVPIRNQEITDSISQFYPWKSLVADFWRAGKVPLWNSFMFSGTPFLATLHSAALYPLNALYLVLGDASAWTMLIFAQIVLSAIFMYLFLHELGLYKTGALLGAITFSLSGYMIAWLEFGTGGQAGLWLPLILLFGYKLVRTKSIKWLLPIAITFFFVFTAGDFQVPLYISILYVVFGGFLVIDESKHRIKEFVKVIAGLILGVVFALPQLLPTVELFARSVRVDDPYIKEYFYGIMHWEKVVNFIWPDFFGNVVTRNYWGKFGYHEYLGFVGVVALVFIFYSLIRKKDRIEKFFWVILLVSLLFLFPTPLAFLPYKFSIPALGTSSASRLLFILDFCLATLAAIGFSKWSKTKDQKILKVIGAVFGVTISVALGIIVSLELMGTRGVGSSTDLIVNLKVSLRNMIPSTLVLIAFGVMLAISILTNKFKHGSLSRLYKKVLPLMIVILVSAEMLRFAWKNTPFSPTEFLYPTTSTIEFLQNQEGVFRIAGGIPTNYFMQYGLSSLEGYDPLYPFSNALWYSVINHNNLIYPSRRYGLIHDYSSSLLNYSSVKYVIDYKKNRQGVITEGGKFSPGISQPRYQPVLTEGRAVTFENTDNLPFAWISANYEVILDEERVIERLVDPKASRERLIVIDEKLNFSPKKEGESEVVNINTSKNKIEVTVDTKDDTLLFISETYYPGWRAFVDREEVDILRANFLYQAIPIKNGSKFVEFIYDPVSFKIGKVVAISVFAGLLTAYWVKGRAESLKWRRKN